MQVDEKPIVPLERNLDSNFVDDDDLQAALARSRRAKLAKPKKLSPEEVARRSQCIFRLPPSLICSKFCSCRGERTSHGY